MEQNILDAIECLKKGIVKKVSANIFALPNAVVFRDVRDSSGGLCRIEQVIAIKTNSGVILGNSSRMAELEDQRYRLIIQPARIQRIMSEHVTMIPFSVFIEAGLDLMSCEIEDANDSETLLEYDSNASQYQYGKKIIERHFMGARLFKATPKNMPSSEGWKETPDKYFLCDVDRRETEFNIVNFFLAELPEKCETIEDAYYMLKPLEVGAYESVNKTQAYRQGEFFFIPSNFDDKNFDNDEIEKIREIRIGNSRPNRVEKGFKYKNQFFVTGKIQHTGREHADLLLPLDQWFKVVPNTSKANFQLTGDID